MVVKSKKEIYPNSQMKVIELKSAVELIKNAESILVLGHVLPDGDSLGSTAALASGLKSINKKVSLWADEDVPEKYRFLPDIFQKPNIEKLSEFDLAIIVDTAVFSRIGVKIPLLDYNITTLVFDHHPLFKSEFDFVCFDTKQAATGCIIFDVLKKMNIPITQEIAAALYTAIITDTGNFTYKNTNKRTFEIAVELIDTGIDVADIASIIYNSLSASTLSSLNSALKNLEFVCEGRGAFMFLPKELMRDKTIDTEEFVNFPRSIQTVEAAAMISELPDTGILRISLRSKKPEVDVSKLAMQFGGGGHKCAAGAKVKESLETFLPKFRFAMEKFLN